MKDLQLQGQLFLPAIFDSIYLFSLHEFVSMIVCVASVRVLVYEMFIK